MLEATLKSRFQLVESRLVRACEAALRNRSDVQLVAVSKGHSIDNILEAYHLGMRDFGESYVQEWLPKYEALKHISDIRWHFIGHLQSNKAKFVVGKAYLIHSVDRVSVLEAVAKAAKHSGVVANVLVEIQVDPADANKGGVEKGELASFLESMKGMDSVRVRGFMGMGPAEASDDELKSLYDSFVKTSSQCFRTSEICNHEPWISLGMSDDLEVAIASGSTIVRIGTALFGERVYPSAL
jgi:pyridoxal phosphate enzyme (YggS family)